MRIGNGAFDQKQHDVWGAILDSVWVHKGSRDRVDDRLWTILARFVDAAIKNWTEPDRASGRSAGNRSTSPRRR